ncbi:Myoneurin [Eumeta japonica]|uniref:Myoneurin n=1 Tax=Eumeta variegata TaxID=151549 RepID=A0A4C1VVH2_EUMVA|nr:Myoneurin [Eumeta japonica]
MLREGFGYGVTESLYNDRHIQPIDSKFNHRLTHSSLVRLASATFGLRRKSRLHPNAGYRPILSSTAFSDSHIVFKYTTSPSRIPQSAALWFSLRQTNRAHMGFFSQNSLTETASTSALRRRIENFVVANSAQSTWNHRRADRPRNRGTPKTCNKKCGWAFTAYRLADGILKCAMGEKKYYSLNSSIAHTLDVRVRKNRIYAISVPKNSVFKCSNYFLNIAYVRGQFQKLIVHPTYGGSGRGHVKIRILRRDLRNESGPRRRNTIGEDSNAHNAPDSSLLLYQGNRPYVKSVHEEGGVDCEFCGKIYRSGNTPTMHMNYIRLHEKDVHCPIREKWFSDKKHAWDRMTYSHERPYRCKVCKKGFKNRDNLSCHRSVHDGDRTLLYAVCGFPFNQTSTMKHHVRKL